MPRPTPLGPPAFRLTGADFLSEGGLVRGAVTVAQGLLADDTPAPDIDLAGYIILPGVVDAWAEPTGPAPGAGSYRTRPAKAVLADAAHEAAAQGVTTMWLSQGWSWDGGAGDTARAETMMAAAHARQHDTRRPPGIDLRLAIRCETHTVGTADRLVAALRRYQIGMVLFSDRLPATVERLRTDPDRLPTGIRAQVAAALDQAAGVPRHLCRLAEAFDALGIVYGSLGDRDAPTREYYRLIGAGLCMAPARTTAARAARATDDAVLVSAQGMAMDAMAGMPRTGDIAPGDDIAADMVLRGIVDGLVSASGSTGLAQVALRLGLGPSPRTAGLSGSGVLPLDRAWNLVSGGPARALGLSDRGRIATGLRADLVAVHASTGTIEVTIAGGHVVYCAGEARERFRALPPPPSIAAE